MELCKGHGRGPCACIGDLMCPPRPHSDCLKLGSVELSKAFRSPELQSHTKGPSIPPWVVSRVRAATESTDGVIAISRFSWTVCWQWGSQLGRCVGGLLPSWSLQARQGALAAGQRRGLWGTSSHPGQLPGRLRIVKFDVACESLSSRCELMGRTQKIMFKQRRCHSHQEWVRCLGI